MNWVRGKEKRGIDDDTIGGGRGRSRSNVGRYVLGDISETILVQTTEVALEMGFVEIESERGGVV